MKNKICFSVEKKDFSRLCCKKYCRGEIGHTKKKTNKFRQKTTTIICIHYTINPLRYARGLWYNG